MCGSEKFIKIYISEAPFILSDSILSFRHIMHDQPDCYRNAEKNIFCWLTLFNIALSFFLIFVCEKTATVFLSTMHSFLIPLSSSFA